MYEHLVSLEKTHQAAIGRELMLTPPHVSQPTNKDDPKFVDDGDLICEVVKTKKETVEVRKINSRLELFSVTECHSTDPNLAQVAIDTTDMWFNNDSEVVATGKIIALKETDNYGLYKIEIQIQKWKLPH